MARVITISEDAYKALRALKGNRSFSEVILDLIKEKTLRNTDIILSMAGIGKDVEIRPISETRRELRESIISRY